MAAASRPCLRHPRSEWSPCQVAPGCGVHVVPCRSAVEHVGLEHRVVFHAPQFDVVVAQHVGVVLEVVAELRASGVLEQRLQSAEDPAAIELVRRTGTGVRERHVSGATGLHTERDADDFRLHVVERSRLGIEGDQFRCLELPDPALEGRLVENQLVLATTGIGGRMRGRFHHAAVRRQSVAGLAAACALAADSSDAGATAAPSPGNCFSSDLSSSREYSSRSFSTSGAARTSSRYWLRAAVRDCSRWRQAFATARDRRCGHAGFSPTLPSISSWCASRLSTVVYWLSHFAAVFGPTLGTPGMLSEASPISAM